MGIPKQKSKEAPKKEFVKTICVNSYYFYCCYKITDSIGRVYYVAEPITHGATKTCETEEGLKAILERDVLEMNKFWSKVR